MTDKQRRERIRRLVLAGADITRRPRRRIDAELAALLDAGARRGDRATGGAPVPTRHPLPSQRSSSPPTAAGGPRAEPAQFAALYLK